MAVICTILIFFISNLPLRNKTFLNIVKGMPVISKQGGGGCTPRCTPISKNHVITILVLAAWTMVDQSKLKSRHHTSLAKAALLKQ